jgi:hypothetical protein
MIYDFQGSKYITENIDMNAEPEDICIGCAFYIDGTRSMCKLANKWKENHMAEKMVDDCVEHGHLYKLQKLHNRRKLTIEHSSGLK